MCVLLLQVTDNRFLYVVLEMCDLALQEFVDKHKKGTAQKKKILKDTTEGLAYLHGMNIGKYI